MAAHVDLSRKAMTGPDPDLSLPAVAARSTAFGEVPARGPGASSSPATTGPDPDVAREAMS